MRQSCTEAQAMPLQPRRGAVLSNMSAEFRHMYNVCGIPIASGVNLKTSKSRHSIAAGLGGAAKHGTSLDFHSSV